MILASILLEGNAGQHAICATSSHFCSAEKQFRFPLELGNQRPQSAQWTVTGSGAAVLARSRKWAFCDLCDTRKNCRYVHQRCK